MCCLASTGGAHAHTITWSRVGTVTTLTQGQLCTNDGWNIFCDSTTPTIASGLVGIGSTAPIVSLDLSQEPDALALPSGATTSRPTGLNLANGEIRYNQTTQSVEAYFNGAWNTLEASGAGVGTSGGILAVPQGGTGDNTLTAHGVMLGEGTASIVATTAGPAKTVFIGNGASSDPTFSASPIISGALTTLQSIATTSTDGLVLQNTTAAATNAQQYSPRLHFTGQGWETGTGASQSVDFIQELQPTQSSGSTATGNLVWSNSINGGAYSPRMTLTNAGNVGIGTTSPTALLTVGTTDLFTVNGSGAVTAQSLTMTGASNCCSLTVGDIGINMAFSHSYIAGNGFRLGEINGGANNYITTAMSMGATAAPLSMVDVYGNMAIGTGYATVTAAPTNGMIVQGSVGIGTTSPTSLLHTYDSAAKTAAYTGILHGVYDTSTTSSIAKVGMDIESTGVWTGTSATNTGLVVNATGGATNYAATFNGGNVGIGTSAPGSSLQVNGNAAIGYATSTAAPSNGLAVNGTVAVGSTVTSTGVALDLGSNITTANSTLLLPGGSGGTSARPSTGIAGMLRYNSTTPALESYYNATWNTLLSTNSSGTAVPAAGSSGQMQYNNGGVLGGAIAVSYNNSSNIFTTQSQHTGDVPLTVKAFSGASLQSGIVSYWKFDEDTGSSVGDATGNGSTGTWNGTLGSQWGTGIVNSGGVFNGTDNYVTATVANLPTGSMARSVSVWFKLSGTPPGGGVYAAGYGGGCTLCLFGLSVTGTNLSFQYYNGSIGTSFNSASVGSWVNAVATYDGTTLKVYANGNLVGSGTPVLNTGSAQFSIGKVSINSNYFPGVIDEVGIWNRALTSSEITALYNSGAGFQYPFTTGATQSANLANFLNYAGTTIADIDASGDIATTGTLTATGTASASALIPTGSTAPANGLYLPSGNTLGLATNSTTAIYVNASQQVGVGSASPATGMKVDINGPVKVSGTGSESCTAATIGAMRYNPVGQYFEICSP